MLASLGGCAAPPEPRPPEPPPAPEAPPDVPPPAEPPAQPRVPHSFSHAKRIARGIYRDHRVTLYCQCEYDRRAEVSSEACGYVPRHAGTRSERVEWEHLVAAYEFGAQRACWRDAPCSDRRGRRFGGRRCCRERDPEFRRMEADLMNLSPEIGELNADRSNFRFGEVAGEAREYGACDFEIDREHDTVEPAESVRGDVARAYLYMHDTYGQAALPLAPDAVARFEAWHRADPPSEWERIRNARIAAIQGVSNPWIAR
ncbi:MAG TPA: endonuclease [Polyangiaceae bacterium]|nr:endonuclease [Polyangiaceae bacterium]